MSTELLQRARAGDGAAFGRLTEPHHRELHVHCYRMLGSLQDAEDAVQDTLLAAWRGLPSFDGRSSVRTWLYQVATNRCLNMLRGARRRPAIAWPPPGATPPEPSRDGEPVWLEPYPDSLLAGAAEDAPGPEARLDAAEAIGLAFLTVVQSLPPRQRAVLLLRDVLGFRAAEVADVLGTTTESVTSALKRARRALGESASTRAAPPPRAGSPAERTVVERLVRAYETADVDALVALLTDDVAVTMPPVPLEYHGREQAERFQRAVTFRDGRRYRLVETRANGGPAFGAYLLTARGPLHAIGLLVVTLTGRPHARVGGLTLFDRSVLPRFDLPSSLGA